MAAHAYRLADLSVKTFDGIGGVEDFAQVRREGEERNHLLPVAPPALGDGRIFLPPGAAVKILQPLARRRGRFGLAILSTIAGARKARRSMRLTPFFRQKGSSLGDGACELYLQGD